MSALEKTRLDNIARNNAFLARLNILDANISKTNNQLKAAAPRKRYRSRKSESEDSDSDYVEEKEDEREEEEEEE